MTKRDDQADDFFTLKLLGCRDVFSYLLSFLDPVDLLGLPMLSLAFAKSTFIRVPIA